MPACEIELDDGEEALDGVVYGGDLEEHLGMAHEAGEGAVSARKARESRGSKLCYSLQHTPGLEDEGGQDDAAQVGAGPQLGDDVGENCGGGDSLSASTPARVHGPWRGGSPLPWSGSMTWVSSSVSARRPSSAEDRALPAGGENQLVNMVACCRGKVRNKICSNGGRERGRAEESVRKGGGGGGAFEGCRSEELSP